MHIIKILVCLIVVLISGSCNKQLDLPPDGRITMDEVFSDYNRTRGYLNSCYGHAPAPGAARASLSDEAHDSEDVVANNRYSNWYRGNVTASNYGGVSTDGSPWGSLYQGIRKCNVFLANIESSTAYASETTKAGWKAQAHTLRALYYLQLIKRYGEVPLVEKPLEVGDDYSAYERVAVSKIVEFIINDCREALSAPNERDGFPWEIYDNQWGIMTRAIPYAIMSQAVTYASSPLFADGTFTWDDATKINAEALGQLLANDYKLFDIEPKEMGAENAYALYFLTDPNDQRSVDKETIYGLGSRQEVWRYVGMPSTPNQERAGHCPTQDLVDAYEMANGQIPILGYEDDEHLIPKVNPESGYDENNPYKNRDPRFYATVFYNGAHKSSTASDLVETFVGGADEISSSNRRNTRTGYYLKKYFNPNSRLGNVADGYTRLFRLAEVYLNFAESAYQSHGPNAPIEVGSEQMSAIDAVNKIRARAGMPALPNNISVEDFEQRYRNERRVELAYEEHRFFDVRRWMILDQTDRFVTGMRITKDKNDELLYERFKFSDRNSWQDKYLLYPIEKSEADKMFRLTGMEWQNPGWLE